MKDIVYTLLFFTCAWSLQLNAQTQLPSVVYDGERGWPFNPYMTITPIDNTRVVIQEKQQPIIYLGE